MKVVFLCGGIGKRMFPLTEDKFMFKFLGKTLLEHQIELAKKAGFKDFIVVGNPLNIENIKELCKNIDAKIEFVIQQEPNGMADAILSAKDVIQNNEIILINPNDIFDQSVYKKIITEYKKGNYESYIIGYKVSSYFPGGYLQVNENNELVKIHEKPGEGNEPSNMVNIVIHLHKNVASLLEFLEKTKSTKDDLYECAISKMIENGHKIKVVYYDGFWRAIKYPWDMFDVIIYFLGDIKSPKISKSAKISKKAQIYGGVIIEDNARILENAVIRGPCYIGKNTVIGNNALIWSSTHIGDNCVIGYSTEVKHSYIGDNCWFHMSYVGDSIISENCSFGAGTVTANFRFDEKPIKVNIKGMKNESGLDKLGVIMGSDCKAGINSCIMPGVKVGPNSVIGPGVILTRDLEPNRMIVVNDKSYIIKGNEIMLSPEKKKNLLNRLLKHGYQ